MPELPEVETMVRGIRPFVAGREIADLVRPRCSRRPIAITPSFRSIKKRCVGRKVDAVERFAKRVLLRLSSEDVLAIEPRMTGLMLVADPPTTAHLRLEWRLAGTKGEQSLWFWDRRGLGTVSLYRPEEFSTRIGEQFGPDALTVTAAEWTRICAATRRPIKVALLDQKLIAGIGNLYASEILHVARVHPAKPAASLPHSEIRRLHAATARVLAEAIRYEGSTLGDGTYRNALNKAGGYQNAHRVYARAGEHCPRCGSEIQRIVQAQRSTFFCPNCQR